MSPHIGEGTYVLGEISLTHSSFNINWFKELNIDPRLIVDVGAYDCGDAVRFGLAFPNARVYSFEGCPGRNSIISKNMGNYPITHYPLAVSDTVGSIEWYSASCNNDTTPEKYGAQGSILKHTEHYKRTYDFIKQADPISVECVTLSYVFGMANIDLVHIDVEGAEKYVIMGFGTLRPKLVWVETILSGCGWQNCTSTEDLDALLIPMGYKLLIDCGNDRLYIHE